MSNPCPQFSSVRKLEPPVVPEPEVARGENESTPTVVAAQIPGLVAPNHSDVNHPDPIQLQRLIASAVDRVVQSLSTREFRTVQQMLKNFERHVTDWGTVYQKNR